MDAEREDHYKKNLLECITLEYQIVITTALSFL